MMGNKILLGCIVLTIISGCTLFQSKPNKTVAVMQNTNHDTTKVAIVNEYTVVDTEIDSFVSETQWEGVKCKKYDEDGGYTKIQECIFPNATMIQVYDIIKRIDTSLKDTLPHNNIKYTPDIEGCIEVHYKYKTTDSLLIDLQYQGGVTSIEIIKGNDYTFSKITYSAD